METCSGSPEERYLVQTRTRRERIKEDEETRRITKKRRKGFETRKQYMQMLTGKRKVGRTQ